MFKLCGNKKEVIDNLWSVFTSFGYDEVEFDGNFDENIKSGGKYCYFSGGEAVAAEAGQITKRAYAEKAAMCIEAAIAAGLDDFELTVSDSEVFDILYLFGFEKFININKNISGFFAKSEDVAFAKGCFEEEKCCCSFDLDSFCEVLENYGIKLGTPSASLIFAEREAEGLAYDTAFNLRVNGCIVEFYNGKGDITEAEKYAENKGIDCILRVYTDGRLEIKDYGKNEIIDTTVEEFLGYYEDEEEECGCGHDHHHGEDCDCGHCH